MKNICPDCRNLIPRGIIITEPAEHKGVVQLQSPRSNDICLMRQTRMDNLSVAACPNFHSTGYSKAYQANKKNENIETGFGI